MNWFQLLFWLLNSLLIIDSYAITTITTTFFHHTNCFAIAELDEGKMMSKRVKESMEYNLQWTKMHSTVKRRRFNFEFVISWRVRKRKRVYITLPCIIKIYTILHINVWQCTSMIESIESCAMQNPSGEFEKFESISFKTSFGIHFQSSGAQYHIPCKFKNRLLKTQGTCHRKCMSEVKVKKKEIQLVIVNRDYHKSMIFQYVLCTRDELVFSTSLIGREYLSGLSSFFTLYRLHSLYLSIYLFIHLILLQSWFLSKRSKQLLSINRANIEYFVAKYIHFKDLIQKNNEKAVEGLKFVLL